MSVLNLIRKVGEQEYSASNFVVFIKQRQKETIDSVNGLIRRFRFRPLRENGFYKFYVNHNQLTRRSLIDNDDPQVYDYLQNLPKINMVACRPIDGSEWLAIPENNESAALSGIIGSQVVSNCECEYFDHIICAITQDSHLVYIENDLSFNNELINNMRSDFLQAKEELRTTVETSSFNVHKNALDIAIQEIHTIIEEREAERKKQRAERIRLMQETVQGRIRLALDQTNARLINCIPRRDLVEITWRSPSGRNYNSVLNLRNLNVINAGICLRGEDKVFDLTSLVSVVIEGENKRLIHVTR